MCVGLVATFLFCLFTLKRVQGAEQGPEQEQEQEPEQEQEVWRVLTLWTMDIYIATGFFP
jgi:hypothetical protein